MWTRQLSASRSSSTTSRRSSVVPDCISKICSYCPNGVVAASGARCSSTSPSSPSTRGCGRMEWAVLDWNESAIAFLQRIGARVMNEWKLCRLTGEALRPGRDAEAMTVAAAARNRERASQGSGSTISTARSITSLPPPIRCTSSAGSRSPADREVVGFCAAALAFGRVASVLQSIESLLARDGSASGAVRPRLRSSPRASAARAARASMDSRPRSAGAADRPAADAARGGLDRGVLSPGRRPAVPGRRPGARFVFDARAGDRPARRLRASCAAPARRVLLLPAAVGGQRLQAAQPVSAVDGSPRRDRPWRLDEGLAGAPDRAARHPRHSPGTVPAADALHEPGLEDGRRHHERAARRSIRRIRCASTSRCATSA